ncbi:MAG: SDR family oxidoreductase [Lentisphaerae bacterium]|nr:SDR family oxidoreductase [Lentisphaerota bacterium]
MRTIDLNGKTALVTGATGDLGRVMIDQLANCGADTAIHYRTNQSKAEELAAGVLAKGRRAVTVQADVGDRDSVMAMREEIAVRLAAPDIVVANAVEQIAPWDSVLGESEADYESQFRTCVLQNVFLAQAFVPAMQAKGWGRYIAINTECTMQCDPSQSAYVSGKGGQDRLLRVLAKEVGKDGITVNQVAPGWTLSDRYRDEHGGFRDPGPEYTQALPLKRRTRDVDVAYAVCFLASDLAASITGVYLPVCSGNVMSRI